MISLGDKARDKITGFTGIVVGRTLWINGCSRLGIQAETLHEGKPLDTLWFDDVQIELIEPRKFQGSQPDTTTGGPRPDPPRARDPH